MNLKPVILSTNDLKKNVYKILDKFHSLENKKNLKKVYSKKYKDEYYIVLLINHINKIMQENADIFAESNIGDAYIKQLQLFYSGIQNCAAKGYKINRKALVSLLKCHTKTFNYLLENNKKIVISQELQNQWIKSVRANCVIWG